MEEYDLEVMRSLRNEPRQRMAEIARKLGISRQSAMRSLKRIEGYIIKYTTIPDFRALGFQVHAIILFHPKNRRLLSFLKKSQNVNSVAVSLGSFAVIAGAVFRNMKSYSEFEDRVAGLCASKRVHFVVEEVKQEDAGC